MERKLRITLKVIGEMKERLETFNDPKEIEKLTKKIKAWEDAVEVYMHSQVKFTDLS